MIEAEASTGDPRYEKRRAVLIYLLAPVFLFAGIGVIFLLILVTDRDVMKAYPNPEHHESVRRFKLSVPRTDRSVSGLAGSEERRDFDGDGVPDVLSLEYFNMEPLFRPSTSGMVFVHSGATGAVLLAHAVPIPLDFPKWYGDIDGNGTMDVLARDPRVKNGRVVLGFTQE